MVLLADRQWTAAKQDEAIATLRNFIAKSPDHPAAPTAKASLGAKLMAQGKSADASKVFSELASDPAARFIAPYALVALGDIAKAAGKLSEAEGAYTKAKTDFPGSSFAEIANGRLASVKAKAPVEIEPAPPSAPPAPAAAAPVMPEPAKVEAPKVESPPTQAPAPAPAQEPKPVSRENKSKKAPAAAKTKP
jgi:tetratricopeptide (TPR) repeat protein